MYGKQCENICAEYCTLILDNKTLCSEQTGMCLNGCKTGYIGAFCPQDVGKTKERQTSLSAALGGGLGGGSALLIIIVIAGMFWFRKRRRPNTEQNDLQNNDIVQDARRDYDIVDTNLREVELNDLRYETLEVSEVYTIDHTSAYSSIPEQEDDIITYENVIGGL
ncbi:hypothetical protein MAR_031464 [Mya arenaria]|uniref:Uncharacterized protein n=1 Tax=Mya arenaria TaxID=6604 RepID=A0ABY7F505_MYAAR|nr:hypothetical protein MAR_031464 [Mya arenaria]